MIHKVVVCERCGSRLDLTDVALDEASYLKNIFDRRSFTIKTIGCNRAAGTVFEDRRVDLCDGCYNRIERFIMGGEEYDNILENSSKLPQDFEKLNGMIKGWEKVGKVVNKKERG